MGFLGSLADQLSSQLGLASNNATSLNSTIDGQNVKYGSLGNFATRFDQSSERRYLEEGYLRVDPYSTNPRQLEILWQQPEATVLVKKRMFSSIAENYRPDFMDADETLFYKALCYLFEKKCAQIAALEQLSKIQQVTSAVGNIAAQLIPAIITLSDNVNNGYATGGNTNNLFSQSNPFTTQDATSFFQVVNRLRTLSAFNQTAHHTTWLPNVNKLYQSTFGPGSGVIEITNFTNISTSNSVDLKSPGQFQLSIVDPYQSMLITDYDIEIALSNATNYYYNNAAVTFGAQAANQTITDNQNKLNRARANRNASPITFQVDSNSIFGQPVTAIIDRLGLEIPFDYDAFAGLSGNGNAVSVTSDYLRGGNLAGYDGLDTLTLPIGPNNDLNPVSGNSELSLFTQIILATFQQLTLLKNTSNNRVQQNSFTNYARKKLRFLFSGKLIIQPMDVVHIYMKSQSQFDNKILAGLQSMYSGVGILGNVNANINNLTNGIDTLLNPSANLAIQAEKAIYVGPDFPNYLWMIMRSQFVAEIEGTHVFAGVVTSANDSWSNGSFIMNIGGEDNTYYFKQGKVNFKPGVDAFNGLIFDPLTPFKSNFDTFTGNATSAITSSGNSSQTLQLLDENLYLMSNSASGSMVKYKQGSLAGEKATQGNWIQDQSIDPSTGRLTKVFYAPDGLSYKWKQGIGVFAQSGSIQTINTPNLVGNPNIFAQPFAGLDIMNVLSLLVTGIPYNYATYFKATSTLNGIQGDPNSKLSNANTFIDSLRTDLVKTNLLWGNFIPFKSLVMNQEAVAQALQAQLTATSINSDLDSKLQQFAVLQNNLQTLGAINALTPTFNVPDSTSQTIKESISSYSAQVANLQTAIQQQIIALHQSTQQSSSQFNIGTAYTSNSNLANGLNINDPKYGQIIRREINFLTRRMSYDVRSNQDKNLFIVDDYYDTDYDIAAFNSALTDGIKLYGTEYTSVYEKIMITADLLNLEVFADTQGHIRVRPPQYNRMPSSTFYRMLYLQKVTGIQTFPDFLNNLFTNQLNSLQQQIEVTEDYIRLNCALLGQYPSVDITGDKTAQQFIANQNTTSGMSGTFSFISDSTDNISNISNLIKQATQEITTGSIDQSLGNFNNIKSAGISTNQLFNNGQRYTILLQALEAQNSAQTGGTNVNNYPSTGVFTSSVVQTLITRLQSKSGQTINSMDYLTKRNNNTPIQINTGQTVDFFKITNDLVNYINQWQKQIKLFYKTIRNAAEFQSLYQDPTTTNNLLLPNQFGNQYVPEIYQHMIEDETYDDYGPGSGHRYIIKTSQIKSLTISENPPPWTTVEVQGTLSPLFDEKNGGGGPAGFNNFPGGGNNLVTAVAIDYDMWRNYGFKEPHPVQVPFLNDPVSQCAPYAAMILTRNRSNILQGTLTISGNEYMQPGEVIYLEDRNLLFYVNSVRHSFTQAQSFNTTLELTYGHSIGDYIPTYLDTIGKIIYKNQDQSNTIIQRQDSSANEKNLGIIQLDGQNASANVLYSGSENDVINNYSNSNQTVINNILYTTSYLINANGAVGNNNKASIELRIYYDKNKSSNDNLINAANSVKSNLTGGNQGPQSFAGSNQSSIPTLSADSVNIVTISLDDENDRRSPSQQALAAARNQMANTSLITSVTNGQSSNIANNNQLRTALFSYIIDCWITFTQVPSTVASGDNLAGY